MRCTSTSRVRSHLSILAVTLAPLVSSACGEASAPGEPQNDEPGVVTGPTDKSGLNAEQQVELQQLALTVDASRALDADALLAKRAPKRVESLGYDPLQSEFMVAIAESALALSPGELDKLGQNGFVISKRQSFPTFLTGYAAIYSEHLPVYISADGILEAVHSSYDTILLQVEQQALIPMLDELLSSMHLALPGSDFDTQTKADVDLYLAVARSLLAGTPVSTVAGGDAASVQTLYDAALAANGFETVELFGVKRNVDTSQFTPRGHYEDEPAMQQYFRAMMWLGRIDLRLIETQSDGSMVFRRPQYDAMLQLRALMSEAQMNTWTSIDSALQTFVGKSDSMTTDEIDSLLNDMGGLAAARAASDEEARAAIEAGGYGLQQIASHLMVNGGVLETLPLSRSYLLFGQRFVVDSHVFSQVVYDRVGLRMMPDPLDVAYAALGNDAALPLLDAELRGFGKYPGALEAARELVDAHPGEFWGSSLYNEWLGALRELSPASDMSDPSAMGMPRVTGTEAWSRRLLNTQLGSWAELRHDTLLYAKQSYTGIPSCDYPDAYVDPYPEFFGRVGQLAELGVQLAESLGPALGPSADLLTTYFNNLRSSMVVLEGMAKNQRDGVEFSEEQMAFVNRAVRIVEESAGCATVRVPDGWMANLYFVPEKSIEFDPTIADVHTQPADESGAVVGRVLHVAAGYPRLMVVTADTCVGPRAYVGVTFSYHERVTEDFERLTDSAWAEELFGSPQADVPWMEPVLAE